MNQTAKTDLNDMTDCLESLIKLLPKLSKADKIDIGARISAVKRSAEKIDESIKGEIKEWKKQKEGVVKGELFEAVLSYNDITRLNQTRLKEEAPDLHKKYSDTKPEARITYRLR